MTYYVILHISMCLTIYHFFGVGGLKFQAMYTVMGTFMTEFINYQEHYGLERLKDENGIYESVSYMHSWNSVSSPLLFRIQRHSDHHAHVFRPYQILRRLKLAPEVPYTYVSMLWISLVPPLYFRVMNSRVKSINDAKKGISNEDQWNQVMPQSEKDKQTHRIVQIYFLIISIVFTVAAL